jgi:hypothetical protein
MAKPSNYKTVSYTPTDPDIIEELKKHTGFNKYPQTFIRDCLYKCNYVRVNATKMEAAMGGNFGSFEKTVKIRLYNEDHALLKARADELGCKIQLLITTAIATVMLSEEFPFVKEQLQTEVAAEREAQEH